MSNVDVRIAIVGTGFAGLGTAVNLKRAGIDDFVLLERAHDVGGTWRENTYPGCQCDVPSSLYSFSFAPNPEWTRTYPLQAEIWEYLRGVAREHGITPHIRFGETVTAASWDGDARRWRIDSSGGSLSAQMLVLGVGALSEPSVPAIPGLDSFAGTAFHSARWDHDHDLRDKRVAVIGTGASAIQFVPRIQPQLGDLQLYQRTPAWVMPHADRAVTRAERAVWRVAPRSQHAWRAGVWAAREAMVLGLTMQPKLMAAMEAVAKTHLRRQVPDPELRRRLTPDFRLGCKRILVSDEYYPTLSRPGVEVITDGIESVHEHSIITRDGTEREVDTIIFGTGFQATAPPSAAYMRGRDGVLLADRWRATGMSAYLGAAIAGFPNAFVLTGPNTGLGHSSMVYMIESQIAHVMSALETMEARGADTIEVRADVQQAYNVELQRRLARTVWSSGGCRSWYLDANGRNTTLWPSFTFRFRRRARRLDPADYELSGGAAAGAPSLRPLAGARRRSRRASAAAGSAR